MDDFARKLTAARSMADGPTVCQEGRQLEMFTENFGRRVTSAVTYPARLLDPFECAAVPGPKK